MGILKKPVEGWRIYDVWTPGILVSNANVMMPREKAVSYCRGGWRDGKPLRPCRGSTPRADCTCGFYAFKTEEQLFDSYYVVEDVVIAKVAMWGTVHEHENGWRGEFTYPQEMWAFAGRAMACRLRLIQEYGVPIGTASERWPELYEKLKRKRLSYVNRADKYDTEQELMARIADGDKAALKTMKARLSSALCGRRKALVRLEDQHNRVRQELSDKQELYDSLRRIK